MRLTEVTNSLAGLDKSSLAGLDLGFNGNKHLNQQQSDSGSFSSILKNSIKDVNDTQVDAYNAMDEIATGKVENLQEAVQKIQEAELSLKLGLEVKNKALGAYKQVMSMQI